MSDSLTLICKDDDIKQIINLELKNSKIICFDFISHRNLRREGIPHQIIDDYFKEDDKKNITG